jgi:hypothetical protein
MRQYLHLKFSASVLLLVILTISIVGLHKNAHAQQSSCHEEITQLSQLENPSPCQCPGSSHEQHKDYDGCDNCANCACHASLGVDPFRLSYNPTIRDLLTTDPFNYLLEVYLPKFIPPQIQA